MKIIDFIKKNNNWEELITTDPYNIKVTRDNGYVMFKYNQLSSDFSLDIVRECRGLILREHDMTPVCYPFEKFGNYGECYCPEINWKAASVQEKIDGSLMKVWYDNAWHISTNGTINAFKADLSSIKYKTFGDLFIAALPISFEQFIEKLDKNFTYMFELVSPYNRVVIPYSETKLYFLGLRDNISGKEYMPETSNLYLEPTLFAYHLFDIPKRFKLTSLSDVQAAAAELPWDEEGYVVCDDKFNRVKIKSPEYVKAHYIRGNNEISYERLLDVLLSGERVEFLTYAGDFKDELDKVERAYCLTIAEIKTACSSVAAKNFESRKDLAMYVKTKPAWIQGFMFAYDKLDEHLSKIKPNKWVEFMKAGGYLDA